MKKYLNASMIGLLLLSLGISGCSDDDQATAPEGKPVKVSFESEVHEPGGDITSYEMVLKLSEQAAKNGSVRISLAGKMGYGQQYYTEPAAQNGVLEVALAKDQNTARFKVHKLADLPNGENILQMILQEPTEGFSLGDPSMSLLRFRKNTPLSASIAFTTATSEVWEDDTDGIELRLELSAALSTTEQVTIDFEASDMLTYGEDYTTDPALVLGQMLLEVPAGETGVTFRLMPVDNNQAMTDYQINLAISATTGYLVKGDLYGHVITLREDDDLQGVVVHTIAELRDTFGQYPGDWYLPEDYYIEGVITSGTNVADGKTAYIQDATAGIMLRFTPSNVLNYGDKVRLNLKNATGNTVNGQKAMTNIVDLSGTLLDEDVEVIPQEISLEQLASGAYEGRRVRISGITFTQANGSNTFAGNRIISNGTFSALVKTYEAAEFATGVLPEGVIAIQGIVGDFGYLLPQRLTSDIDL